MYVNSVNPTVSTASRDLVIAAPFMTGWKDQVWDFAIRVPVVTLDELVAQYGIPEFIKIDVEGHEAEVLMGLNVPIRALSFEFTTIQRSVACACIDRLNQIGRYELNLSLGEKHALRHKAWITPARMKAEIAALPDTANSGDVYARLV